MKKSIVVIVSVIGATFLMSMTKTVNEKEVKIEMVKMKSDYEKGWEEGYCEGWKDVKGKYAICPITPICPIPKIDCSEGYKCGYNRGFKSGMEAAKK
jgi:hypothetical protein